MTTRRSGDGTGLAPVLLAIFAFSIAACGPDTQSQAGASAVVAGPPHASTGWRLAAPEFSWSFPRDHWTHPDYRTEWWYFTGHLEDEHGGRYGYQLTFFRVGLAPRVPDLASDWAAGGLLMAHAAVSDLGRERYFQAEVLYRLVPFLAGFGEPEDPRIVWSRGPPGTDRDWRLDWARGGFSFTASDRNRQMEFRLQARMERAPVLHGDAGYSRKGAGPGAASHYYSFTRMRTEGTLSLDGRERPVHGSSWMDREFGSNQLEPGQRGWDWFGLQLADGRDVMLYVLRDRRGEVDFARGTLVAKDGSARELAPGTWTLQATGFWESPGTDTRYPAGWRLEIPGEALQLSIVPEMAAQEFTSGVGLRYWEGAVRATGPSGRILGRGYVELTGYGDGNRPPV